MDRETTLAASIAAVVVISVVTAALVPGAVAERDREPVRPVHLDVSEVTIQAGEVSGSTATLVVNTSLRHRGGPADNVTVVVRAVELESGLLQRTVRRELDTVEGETEVTVSQPIDVERTGGYRIETIVYRDGRRVETGAKEVRGVGTLQPEYARTDVEFHRFEGGDALPPIQYTVEDVAGNRTTLELSSFLTNRGDGPSEQLRLVFVVRQSDSNIVAARTAVDVGTIAPGRTASSSATVTVPDNYNYYLDAVLWKDGVIVGSARSVANLDPTEEIRTNVTRRSVGIEVGDFERGQGGAADEPVPTDAAEAGPGAGGVPGFGPGAALAALALAGAALLARRRHA